VESDEIADLGDLEPVLPSAPASEPEADAVVFDLDAEPSLLDSALDLSSLEGPAAEGEPFAVPQPAQETAGPTGTEPIAELDNESEQRVANLLTEGQAAFDKAEYQSAIDAWSRIFLIDIDHPEANRRIDLARKLKAEIERKLEETFHDALSKVEAGQLDEARRGFESVLEMMPGHIGAQEYLDRLEAPDFVPPEPAPVAEPKAAAEAVLDEALASEGEFSEDVGGMPDELPTPPGEIGEHPRPAVEGTGKATKPSRSPNKTFRFVGAAALIVFAVVGWFLYKNWNNFFPNASDTAAPVQLDPITRAKRTYAEAGAAIAVAQLRRLSPGHPQYAEAQALVAQWEASLDATKPESDGPGPEVLEARDQLVGEAETAFQEKQFLLAQELLERAASQAPLEEAAQEMLDESANQLDALKAEIVIFREGEWEMALRSLWRIWESGTTTPDVRRLMVDSYFNLGVRDLQRKDSTSAIDNFKEARELSVDDAEIARLVEFAELYQTRSEDLLYRIFVKSLPFR
jgi:tetratricopeptide (TPR) repeat protein